MQAYGLKRDGSGGLPEQWAIWPGPATDGPTNMATDSALMESAVPGFGVWRWYSWSRPTVSFGRNERVAGRFSPASVKRAGLDAVRRPTGGRALLHSRELTYSVTFDLPLEYGWRDAYGAVNRILHSVLRSIGIEVTLAGVQPPVRPVGPICFDMPAEGELVIGGRKLVGSAVWRQGTRYLQHGSILLHDDQARLADAAVSALPPAPPAASLSMIGRVVEAGALAQELMPALIRELGALGGNNDVSTFQSTGELDALISARKAQFLDDGSLWRER